MQLQIVLLEEKSDINFSFEYFVNIMNFVRDFFVNFKFKFKFKLKCIMFLLLTLLTQCVTGDSSSSDYIQSFERVAVFHNNVTYGHLGVTMDFDGYMNHFHVLRKSVISFEEKNMSVYVKSVFKIEEYKSLFLRTRHRSKRQFLAGVGVALGAAALYEVEAMKGIVNELVSNQNLLVKKMVSVTNTTVLWTSSMHML